MNASKSELLRFRHPNKKLNYDLKIKIDGMRLYPSKYDKYLGFFIDSHNWSQHTNILAAKLSHAIYVCFTAIHCFCVSSLSSHNTHIFIYL